MTSATQDSNPAGRRQYLLAEFRCALVKAKMAQLDIESVAMALQLNIVTPEQAVAIFWDSQAIQYLGLGLRGAT